MSQDIHQCWAAEQLPIFNAVFHADGRVVPLRIKENQSGALRFAVTAEPVITIDRIDLTRITHVSECYTCEHESLDLVAHAGGTSYESDGYVALTRRSDGGLLWLAFFDRSSAFEEVRFEESAVVAITNDRHEWRLPLDGPERISVIAAPDRRY